MSRSTYTHLHQYVAFTSNKKSYRCMIEDCPHSMPASALLNRKAACCTCGTELIVTKEHLRRSHITCISTGCAKKFAPNLPLKDQPGFSEEKLSAAALLDKMGLTK